MNELPGSRIHALHAKGSGVARGQILQVAVRKCMAETYSTSKKKKKNTRTLERDHRFIRPSFIRNRFGQC